MRPLKEFVVDEISTKLHLPFFEGKSCLIFQLFMITLGKWQMWPINVVIQNYHYPRRSLILYDRFFFLCVQQCDNKGTMVALQTGHGCSKHG